jgi:uncharacterized protein (TIGR02246 family)
MSEMSPVAVVRGQFDAYNARDVDRFLSYYADDAAIFDAAGDVMETGRDALHRTFTDIFARMPTLHAEYRGEMAVGDWVAIHSLVREWTMSDGTVQEMQWIELLPRGGRQGQGASPLPLDPWPPLAKRMPQVPRRLISG